MASKLQHKCAHPECDKDATKKCGACCQVYYCSKKCQCDHWKLEHKKKCKDLKAQNIIYQTLASITKQIPSSILFEISEYALGEIKNCEKCNNEILKLHYESEKFMIADNGLFCTECISKHNLTSCSCNEMKAISKLQTCWNCWNKTICDGNKHKQCIEKLCEYGQICIGCKSSPICSVCRENKFCHECLIKCCTFCEYDFDKNICKSCAYKSSEYYKCCACNGCICPNCKSKEYDVISCSIPNCNGKFHTIYNAEGMECCKALCDGDYGNCSRYPVCITHNENEMNIWKIQLGMIKCDGCNKHYCRNSLCAGNVCLFCIKEDDNDNVISIKCRECCNEHRCGQCNVNIHFCRIDRRCSQANQHDFPPWYLNK